VRAPVFLAFTLAATACSGGSQNQAAPAANAPEPVGNQIAGLSEGQRNAVFIRALRDAGQDCQHVDRSVPAGSYQGQPVWRATCQGGGEWTILIGADGTAQVLPEGSTIDTNQAGADAATGNGQ
jgi:hypothetical protein